MTGTQIESERVQKVSNADAKEYVSECALEWAKMMQPEVKLEIDNVRRIKTKEEQAEYMVGFKRGNVDYGYAILKNESNDFIVNDGVIQEGCHDLYEEIVESIEKNANNPKKIGKKIIKISDRQYGVLCEEKEKFFYDDSGNILDYEDTVEVESYKSEQSIFISTTNWTTAKYKTLDSLFLKKYKKRGTLFSSGKTTKITGKYACAVQALLQIAYMEEICDGTDNSIKKIYDSLWTKCKTTKIGKQDDIICGSNTIKNAAKGFVNYAKSLGFDTEYKGEQQNPSVAWLKDKLEYNRPIIMGYTVDIDKGDGKTEEFNHAISVLGWVKAKKISSGNTYNYLVVYDGWNNTHKYLNYTTVDFSKYCSASYFWIKK